VLDFVDYTNLPADQSYGSFPNGQSFNRQIFLYPTPSAANDLAGPAGLAFVPYSAEGSVYSQNFNILPSPVSGSVNSANPVTVNGVIYALADPYSFAAPVQSGGNLGGMGLPELAGWYGMASLSAKFGASFGDQSTGGQISFGLPGSSNRALGLLATSSTGPDAFGVKFLNQTPATLHYLNVQLTGELWRQSDLPKTLQAFYYVDSAATNGFPLTGLSAVHGLDVSFAPAPGAVGGVAVDGTAAANQIHAAVVNQSITGWAPGAALWLLWQMTDATGKAQGLAIDDFSFSAVSLAASLPNQLTVQSTGTGITMNWISVAGQTYQLEFTDDLAGGTWTALGLPFDGTGAQLTINLALGPAQRFFRLHSGQ
jgi:hypothetical protein